MGSYSGPIEILTVNYIVKRRNPDPKKGMKRHAYKNQKATEVVRPSSNDTQLVTRRQTTTSYIVTTIVELYDRNSRNNIFQRNALTRGIIFVVVTTKAKNDYYSTFVKRVRFDSFERISLAWRIIRRLPLNVFEFQLCFISCSLSPGVTTEATTTPKLLSAFVNPEVGDPLGADQNRASRVTSQKIAITRRQQIVPKHG